MQFCIKVSTCTRTLFLVKKKKLLCFSDHILLELSVGMIKKQITGLFSSYNNLYNGDTTTLHDMYLEK